MHACLAALIVKYTVVNVIEAIFGILSKISVCVCVCSYLLLFFTMVYTAGLGTQQKTGLGGGLFGQSPALGGGGIGGATGGGLFGQTAQTGTTGGGGLFAKTQTPASGIGGGLFKTGLTTSHVNIPMDMCTYVILRVL